MSKFGPELKRAMIQIATFNIQTFGPKKASNSGIMETLAQIIRKYDLVAVQEIKDKDGEVPVNFLEKINEAGVVYKFLISERTGKNPDDSSSKEQYAYYYNTGTIEVLDKGGLYDDRKPDHFQREPFVSRFKTKKGNFSFVLISIHTRPCSAAEEIAALEHVVKWARVHYPKEDDFIMLGDFNADCNYISKENLEAISLSGSQYTWIIPNSADTNVSTKTSCAYDRIVTTKGIKQDFTGEWGVNQAFKDKEVSDHWPVWAEFFIDRDNAK